MKNGPFELFHYLLNERIVHLTIGFQSLKVGLFLCFEAREVFLITCTLEELQTSSGLSHLEVSPV